LLQRDFSIMRPVARRIIITQHNVRETAKSVRLKIRTSLIIPIPVFITDSKLPLLAIPINYCLRIIRLARASSACSLLFL
jgi:hypothetical protein